VALPVAIAASVMFVPVVVDTIILVLLLALLAGMAYAYRKFVGQTRKLMDELKLLEDDQEATISILGGFLSVTLEQSTETTTVPKIMADDRHKDSGAKPAGLLMDRRPN
jgi:hypothetical protein